MRRVLIAAAIALDFIAPRTADRLATWLWTHAVEQALAYQREATPAHAHPIPRQTPPVPATTPDAPHPNPKAGPSTCTERDAETSQQNP